MLSSTPTRVRSRHARRPVCLPLPSAVLVCCCCCCCRRRRRRRRRCFKRSEVTRPIDAFGLYIYTCDMKAAARRYKCKHDPTLCKQRIPSDWCAVLFHVLVEGLTHDGIFSPLPFKHSLVTRWLFSVGGILARLLVSLGIFSYEQVQQSVLGAMYFCHVQDNTLCINIEYVITKY